MTDYRPTGLQLWLITVAIVTYIIGWVHAVANLGLHAIGWWVLTVLAAVGAIAHCLVRRVMPVLTRIVQLEYRQLDVLKDLPQMPNTELPSELLDELRRRQGRRYLN